MPYHYFASNVDQSTFLRLIYEQRTLCSFKYQTIHILLVNVRQCDQKKSPNVLPKNDFTRKMIDFDSSTKIPKNVRDLGKLIVAKSF